MNPTDVWRLIRRTGRIAEPAPAPPQQPVAPADRTAPADPTAPTGQAAPTDPGALSASPFEPPRELAGSVQVRHIDAGSCNGCEIEVSAAFGPVYDAERYGARLVASPRHADALLVTGVVTRNMAEPLRRTVAATPAPRVVIAVGDCARGCSVYRAGYGVAGAVADVVDVDLDVPGCPPEPGEIIAALRRVTRR